MKKGFTLIEILVVMAIFFTVGVLAIQLFFSSLMGGTKSTVSGTVKENGDYAMTVMDRMIRNARAVTTCSSNSLTLEDAKKNTATFLCDDSSSPTRIASNSADPNGAATGNYFLTSDRVIVNCSAASPLFTCPAGSERKIEIHFNIAQYVAGVVVKPEETSQMDFRTTVTIRNY